MKNFQLHQLQDLVLGLVPVGEEDEHLLGPLRDLALHLRPGAGVPRGVAPVAKRQRHAGGLGTQPLLPGHHCM